MGTFLRDKVHLMVVALLMETFLRDKPHSQLMVSRMAEDRFQETPSCVHLVTLRLPRILLLLLLQETLVVLSPAAQFDEVLVVLKVWRRPQPPPRGCWTSPNRPPAPRPGNELLWSGNKSCCSRKPWFQCTA